MSSRFEKPPYSRQNTSRSLTPREKEVAILRAQGLTQAVVAKELGISPNTVKDHTSNIDMKLGSGTRADRTIAAVANGDLSLEAIAGQFDFGRYHELNFWQKEALDTLSKEGSEYDTLAQIASDLGIAEQTLKNRLTDIHEQLGVKGIDQAKLFGRFLPPEIRGEALLK